MITKNKRVSLLLIMGSTAFQAQGNTAQTSGSIGKCAGWDDRMASSKPRRGALFIAPGETRGIKDAKQPAPEGAACSSRERKQKQVNARNDK